MALMNTLLARLRPGRRAIVALAILLLIGSGLALDLANRGLVWNTFWSLTGEEEPFAQVRGMVEWAGNILRPAPRLAADVPVNHAAVSPFGINTFLQQEVELAKRERQVQMIAEEGFGLIRQQFPWEDIEISGRGDFVDRRNDLNGDGQIDEISAWDKYDNIVGLAEQYGLEILARLDNPPAWTHADPAIGSFAPPDDLQDYVNYAVALAERYKGRIRYYQIWNEPNIYPEWGEQAVSPEGYTELLCRAYTALKQVDPRIVVLSGPLSPTVSLTQRDLNEFIFLQRMYDAGAGDCFDVMSAQAYGFYSGPTDRRLRPFTLTFARPLYIRDLMVVNGDAHKPIWISEAAWNPQPDDPAIIQNGAFGIVTPEQAARYMPLAYQRAQEEWPWIGNMSYWFFKHADDSRRNQAFYYFRMVEPDFTPLPIYDAMKSYITALTPTLYPGVHQAEDWAVQTVDAAPLASEGAQFDEAMAGTAFAFTYHGTHLLLRWQEGAAPVRVLVDDELFMESLFNPYHTLTEDGWHVREVRASLRPQTHHIRLESDSPFTLDAITVADRSFQTLYPLLAGAVIGLGMLLWVVIDARRRRG